MNIFVLDPNPTKAAQLQCDKHVVKMIVESAQMLSTAHRLLDGTVSKRPSKSGKRMVNYWTLPDEREDILYKAVHVNHPCTVWTMESTENYNWHYNHFIALCNEYRYRYGKVHSTDNLLHYKLAQVPTNIKSGPMTKQPLAMQSNPECMDYNDIVGSYQNYYQTKQDRFKMAWTRRPIPEWFNVKSAI
jgi:hypothetical protein